MNTRGENTGAAQKPTSEEVISALRSAGWLLEQETAKSLRNVGFNVLPNKAFPDPDDPSVSRETDVYAYKPLYISEELSLSVGMTVLAECKQSTMPYVIAGQPADARELQREREEVEFRFPRIETSSTDLGDGKSRLQMTSARQYLGLDKVPGNPWEPGFLGTQMTRLDRKKTWAADNRGIFDSLVYPLAKALTHYRSRANRTGRVSHTPGQDWASVTFFYPMVVISAPLFQVDTERVPLKAEEVAWSRITRELKSNSVDGQFNIDVVSSASFEPYLHDRILRFGDAVASLAQGDPQRLLTNKDYSYQG